MASKKFQPPLKNSSSTTSKRGVSLSDKQYEEIFNAVINGSSNSKPFNFQSPIVGNSPKFTATSPKECASLENSQNENFTQNLDKNEKIVARKLQSRKTTDAANNSIVASNKTKSINSESNSHYSESISTVNSEEFKKHAVFSTPISKKKSDNKPSFRKALNVHKHKSIDTSLQLLSQAPSSVNNSFLDEPLSQPPVNVTHIDRLRWLQERRGTGLWVQCDNCDKWRWSEENDPVNLPEKWYCYMNKDEKFNNCLTPEEKISLYVEADLIHNTYTAGTIVWAKVFSYPWWPAMVDDDPDTEQYYWINDYTENIPTHYNVTFFDKENQGVTRAWIEVSKLKSFKHNLNLDVEHPPQSKFKARIKYSKILAKNAIQMPIKDRLKKFSFIVKSHERINTPIPTSSGDDSEDENNETKSKNKMKRTSKKQYYDSSDDSDYETFKKQCLTKKKRRNTIDIYVNNKLEKKISKRRNTLTTNIDIKNTKNNKKISTIKKPKRKNTINEQHENLPNTSIENSDTKRITRRRSTISQSQSSHEKSTSNDFDKNKPSTSNYKTDTKKNSNRRKSKLEKLLNDSSIPKINKRRISVDIEKKKTRKNTFNETKDKSKPNEAVDENKENPKRRNTFNVLKENLPSNSNTPKVTRQTNVLDNESDSQFEKSFEEFNNSIENFKNIKNKQPKRRNTLNEENKSFPQTSEIKKSKDRRHSELEQNLSLNSTVNKENKLSSVNKTMKRITHRRKSIKDEDVSVNKILTLNNSLEEVDAQNFEQLIENFANSMRSQDDTPKRRLSTIYEENSTTLEEYDSLAKNETADLIKKENKKLTYLETSKYKEEYSSKEKESVIKKFVIICEEIANNIIKTHLTENTFYIKLHAALKEFKEIIKNSEIIQKAQPKRRKSSSVKNEEWSLNIYQKDAQKFADVIEELLGFNGFELKGLEKILYGSLHNDFKLFKEIIKQLPIKCETKQKYIDKPKKTNEKFKPPIKNNLTITLASGANTSFSSEIYEQKGSKNEVKRKRRLTIDDKQTENSDKYSSDNSQNYERKTRCSSRRESNSQDSDDSFSFKI